MSQSKTSIGTLNFDFNAPNAFAPSNSRDAASHTLPFEQFAACKRNNGAHTFASNTHTDIKDTSDEAGSTGAFSALQTANDSKRRAEWSFKDSGGRLGAMESGGLGATHFGDSDEDESVARIERCRQSARDCRARKRLRYKFLERMITAEEREVLHMQSQVTQLKDWIDSNTGDALPPQNTLDFLESGVYVDWSRDVFNKTPSAECSSNAFDPSNLQQSTSAPNVYNQCDSQTSKLSNNTQQVLTKDASKNAFLNLIIEEEMKK